jgi:hypothetical protein
VLDRGRADRSDVHATPWRGDMTRPIHFLRGLRIPPGGSRRMIMRAGDMAVIGLDLGATKLAGA